MSFYSEKEISLFVWSFLDFVVELRVFMLGDFMLKDEKFRFVRNRALTCTLLSAYIYMWVGIVQK